MLLNELGEFGLIDRIARSLPPAPKDVVVGIGDDVAVLGVSASGYLLATCDSQVENVHFLRSAITPYQLGRKIVAINVSDIASMGGDPSWALVSLVLPPDLSVGFVDELYRGMGEQMAGAGAAMVGGNLARSGGEIVIDFVLLGQVAPEHLVLRRGAKPGDAVLVTGSPGDSAAGLELILRPDLKGAESAGGSKGSDDSGGGVKDSDGAGGTGGAKGSYGTGGGGSRGSKVSAESVCLAIEKHLTPTPRLAEGRLLGRSGRVHAMLDVSDGLLNDLRHLCRAGRVGAEIMLADLPVSPACDEIARAAGKNPLDWVLRGGEDYELLFTTAPEDAAQVKAMLESETGTPCHVIGRILPETEGIATVSADGARTPHSLGEGGWDHFAGR